MTQATSASSGAGVQSQLQQLISGVPTSLNQLTSPLSSATNAAASPGSVLTDFLDFLDGADGNPIGTFLNSSFLNGLISASYVSPAIITPAITSGMADINSLARVARTRGLGARGVGRGVTADRRGVGSGERRRLGEHDRQHNGRQAVRSAVVVGGGAGGQPQRRHVCRWRVDQCGRPDRGRYRSRSGGHAWYARRGRR